MLNMSTYLGQMEKSPKLVADVNEIIEFETDLSKVRLTKYLNIYITSFS